MGADAIPAFRTTTNLGGTLIDNVAGYTDSETTSIIVDSTSSFASSGVLYIGSEFLSYASKTATTFDTLERGLYGTTASAITNNDVVGEAYDSGLKTLEGFTEVATKILSNTTGQMRFIWYSDSGGTDTIRTLTPPYSTINTYDYLSAPNFGPYVRYLFGNTDTSGNAQTDFYFETEFYTKSVSAQILTLNSSVLGGMTSNLTRSIIVGKDPNGNYKNVPIDFEGHLSTRLSHPTSAFGDIRMTTPVSQLHVSFPYNINTEIVSTTTANSGTISQANSQAVLSTSTNTAGSAILETRRVLKYRTGLGALARFTGLFTTGVASSTQIIGIGDSADGFFFGYNGASFGILKRQNSSDTWTAQSSWSLDVLDGTGASGMTLDQTKGNVFQISFQWLGYGKIIFSIENDSNGQFMPIHEIEYANQYLVPSIYNPSLPIHAEATNSGNNTDLLLKTASMAAFVEGDDLRLGVSNSFYQESTHSTETSFFNLKCKDTIGSITNRVRVYLKSLSIANDVNKLARFIIYLNPTLDITPTWVDIESTNSVIQSDITATYSSGGKIVFQCSIGKDSGNVFDLENLDIFLAPGDIITITSINNTSGLMSASLNWVEDF